MEKSLAILIPIVFFICTTLCVYFVTRFRYDAITKLGGPIPKNPAVKKSWKRSGVVVLGFGLGMLTTGILLNNGMIIENDWVGLFIVGIITLFVGASLVIADRLTDKDQSLDG